MAFEVFNKKAAVGRGSTTPKVTISKNGTFSLNAVATQQMMDGAEYAVLMYDAESKQIAIKPVAKTDEHGYRLSRPKTGGIHISGRRFLAHIAYKHEETTRFEASWNDTINAVVITLA